ncbi:MAG: hypothetical protein EPO06_11970 [Burkholderiaceae bacterium]|nr:MAG: hypothetical protein EPO06_11970 [Burkholderiaceae bacterium]
MDTPTTDHVTALANAVAASDKAWPIGGPYSGEQTTSAARHIGALVRYLNHATQAWNPESLPDLATWHDTTAALWAALQHLPQILAQVERLAEAFRYAPGLAVDDRGEPLQPGEVVNLAIASMRDAAVTLDPVVDALSYAMRYTGRLYIRDAESDES